MKDSYTCTKRTITVQGYKIVTYSYGQGNNVLLCVNGGPGLPCNYLRDAHIPLVKHGFKIVAYDQLGCGESDCPNEKELWHIDRYLDELEQVRSALELEKIHLLGHSWGGWLAIEYAIRYKNRLNTLLLENTCADIPHLSQELDRLRSYLGAETVQMMLRHEAEGSFDHPEYQAALTILNYRHVCRLKTWPSSLMDSLDQWNYQIYNTMQGPNEFIFTGNLKKWNKLNDMEAIKVPTLITVGLHDELPPSCALRMQQSIPHALLKVFKNSSHTPFYEEQDEYYMQILSFLKQYV